MKRFFLIFLISTSCSSDHEIKYLNGYWEIDKVLLENGNERDYTVNTTIDFIELKSDSTGVRKKLQPQIDGSFITSPDFEKFKIKRQGSALIMFYSTPMMSWSEEILEISREKFEVKNENSIRYIYKRFSKFDEE